MWRLDGAVESLPRTSTIERHPKREQIEKAIVAGVPKRTIASQFGVSAEAVQRHKAKLPANLTESVQVERELCAESVYEYIEQQRKDLERIKAEVLELDEPDYAVAVRCCQSAIKLAEVLLRALGELKDRQTNVLIVHHPQFDELARLIREVSCGDCREAIAEVLSE